MIRACPHCGVKNRVPARHLADTGRCGGCKQELPPLSEPLEVDAAEFNEITREARVPVLVDFWAPWCGPCQMAAPMLASTYNIRSIPNFALFRNGVLTWQQPGLLGHRELEQAARGDA